MDPSTALAFPIREVASKVGLSAGIGLLVGLEREWSQKEIGVRTFSIAGLLGMLTSLLAPSFVLGALLAILLLVAFLNVHSLLKDRSLELTTSICLVVVFFLGVLVGESHFFTAATAAIAMMMLLAWKRELELFADALRPEEIRSAVLICLLSVVVFPLLPDRFVDPWRLVNPRQFWTIVVVVAGIGFVNYVASLLLTNVAMFVRNVVILALFAPRAVCSAASPLATMTIATMLWVWARREPAPALTTPLKMSSPVSLKRIFRFSILFLLLACSGTLAQRFLGSLGFLVVSVLGGLVSSASTTATAATLAATGQITPETAGLATILTSVASALINLPLVYQQTRQIALVRRLSIVTVIIILLGGVAWGAASAFKIR